MTIWRATGGAVTEPRTEPCVVTIGSFDGVHRGHQYLLGRAKAAGGGLPLVAVTFDPHPLQVVRPEVCPTFLTTCERRVQLLREHGADEVRALAFDESMAQWSPKEFVERALVDELKAAVVCVGANFRFGNRNAGTIETLEQMAVTHGFRVAVASLEGGDQPYSSTRVRAMVEGGDLAGARELLGRPAEVSGVVAQGDKRGRELGFPTANVPVDAAYAVPPDGVYACWLVVDGERHPAATSVGHNVTFNGQDRRVESFVIDHPTNDLDLYGTSVRVEFIEHLRPMEHFDSVDALIAQMHDDVTDAREVLAADSSQPYPR